MVFFDALNSSDAPRMDGSRSPGRMAPRSIRETIVSTIVSMRERGFPLEELSTVPMLRMVRTFLKLCKAFLAVYPHHHTVSEAENPLKRL